MKSTLPKGVGNDLNRLRRDTRPQEKRSTTEAQKARSGETATSAAKTSSTGASGR